MKKTAAIILMLAVVMSCVLVAVPTVVTAQTGTTTPENLAHKGLIKTVYDFEGYADGSGLGNDAYDNRDVANSGTTGYVLAENEDNKYLVLNSNGANGNDSFVRLNTGIGNDDYYELEAGKTYTISFRFKFVDPASTTFCLSLYLADPSTSLTWKKSSVLGNESYRWYQHSTEMPDEDGWYTVEKQYTAPASFAKGNALVIANHYANISGYQSDSASTSSVYIDDFSIGYVGNNCYDEYVFDWADADGNSPASVPSAQEGYPAISTPTNASTPYIQGGGINIRAVAGRGNDITANGIETTDGGYRPISGVSEIPGRALIMDPEYTYENTGNNPTFANDWLTISAGNTYVITVKFKTTGNAGLGIALSKTNGAWTKNMAGTVDTNQYYSYYQGSTNNEWRYLTTIIDGSGASPAYPDAAAASKDEYKAATLANTISNGWRNVILTTSCISESSDKVTVDEVNVKIFSNDKLTGKIAVPLNPETGEPKMVAVYANGTTLYEMPNPEANAWGEAAEVTGDGAKVKGEPLETLTAHTVYDDFGGYTVSYPTVTMDSDKDLPVAPGTRPAGSIEIVEDDAAHGNVAKVTTNTAIAGHAHAYTTSNYLRFNQNDIGKRFYVTMDVKLSGTIRSDMRFAIKGANPDASYDTDALGNTGNYATWVFVNGITSSASTKSNFYQGTIPAGASIASVTEWTTIGFSFDLTSDYFGGAQNVDLMFGMYNFQPTSGKDAYFYYDNVSVIEVTPGADNFSTGNATTNVMNSIRYEIKGEDYQSAGLRFRATLPEGVAAAADDYGFVAVPAALATTADWYKAENWDTNASNALHKSAKGKHYGDDENTYQLLLSGLTVLDGAKNDVALETQIVAKMYVKNGDEYTYYDVNVTSYKEVKAAYRSYNTLGSASEWAKY